MRSKLWPASLVCTAVAALAPSAPAQDIALKSELTRWRITAEHFEVSGNENLGLLGVHFDVLEPLRDVPQLYFGVGGYAGVIGNRGGLLVGGATAGWRTEFQDGWLADFGLFVGGGGGGSGPTSDGLMLRPHAAIERELGLVNLRFEVAHVDLADFDDTHFALGTSLASEILTAGRASRTGYIPDVALVRRRIRVTPLVTSISPGGGSLLRDNTAMVQDVEMVGAELDYFSNRNWYFPIQVKGAVGGSVDGFALAMTGLGYEWPLGGAASLGAKGLVGAGGGGNVSTGGGLLYGAELEARAFVYGPIEASLSAGFLDAPDGSFDGTTITAGLGWSSRGAELALDYPRSRLMRDGIDSADATIETTRFGVVNKTYRPVDSARKKNGSAYDSNLNLIGVVAEHPIGMGFLAVGRLYGAYDGGVGGYAEGLGGVKWELAPFDDERHVVHVQAGVGAGGGGGADVGSGLIWDVSAGYRMRVTRSASVVFDVGMFEANDGSFEGEAYQVGLSWDLHRAFFH